jgi:hypothetical protein
MGIPVAMWRIQPNRALTDTKHLRMTVRNGEHCWSVLLSTTECSAVCFISQIDTISSSLLSPNIFHVFGSQCKKGRNRLIKSTYFEIVSPVDLVEWIKVYNKHLNICHSFLTPTRILPYSGLQLIPAQVMILSGAMVFVTLPYCNDLLYKVVLGH